MGYSADAFIAGEQPTTAKWNKLWSNDASFNDGTGIANLEIGSGHTSLKNDYKFRVYRNGAATSTNGNVLVTFDTKTYDTGTNYDTSSGKFTAPVSGFYRFYSLVSANGTPAVAWQTFIYKNGSPVSNGINGASASNVTSNVYDEIQLAATDFVQIFIGSGGSTNFVNTSVATYFTGSLISQT